MSLCSAGFGSGPWQWGKWDSGVQHQSRKPLLHYQQQYREDSHQRGNPGQGKLQPQGHSTDENNRHLSCWPWVCVCVCMCHCIKSTRHSPKALISCDSHSEGLVSFLKFYFDHETFTINEMCGVCTFCFYVPLVPPLGGSPPLRASVSTTVLVNLLDLNDNDPTFLNLPFVAEVLEGLPIGSSVFRVCLAFTKYLGCCTVSC